MSDTIRIEAGLSANEVIQRVEQAGGNTSTTKLILDLGTSKKTVLDNDAVEQALVELLYCTFSTRKWKSITLEFSSPGFVEQGSKQEDKWYALEQNCKQQTSRLGRGIQRKLDLDETQIRVDGDVHTEVNPNCDCKYSGVAIISFPQVSDTVLCIGLTVAMFNVDVTNFLTIFRCLKNV